GLHQQLTINQRGLGQGIVVLWGGSTTKPFKGLGKGRSIRFTESEIEYLKKRMPELKEVGGEYSRWGVRIKYQDKMLSEHVAGIYPNYEEMRNHIPQMGGRMINNLDMKLKRRVAFIGYELRNRLFGDEEAVGKQIFINNVPFTVVGVGKDKMQMGMYGGPDVSKASIPATTFATVFGHRYLNVIIYQPYSIDNMKALEKRVYEVFGERYKFDPTDERALWVWDVVENQREMSNILLGIKLFLGIIGGLTLLIAGVGVANIMYVSIKERTREIGIKMAMGARKSYILMQFLIESLIITFLGGFGGMSVSYILTESFKRIPIESDVMDFMGRPTISLEIGLTVIIILGLMGLISGLFPAMRAASVNPVESLRYE
ncbi:MAG: ABC transporter permease, partial [Candidatus Zixiibacteriota bacterium]